MAKNVKVEVTTRETGSPWRIVKFATPYVLGGHIYFWERPTGEKREIGGRSDERILMLRVHGWGSGGCG